jgi:serine protease Do
MPDFGFEGPGVKVDAVVPGSPAEKAGVKPGDVVLKLDGRDVANLRDFSEKLKGAQPGQVVTATLRRDGKELVVAVTLVEW